MKKSGESTNSNATSEAAFAGWARSHGLAAELDSRSLPDFLRQAGERVADGETGHAAAVACAYTRDDFVCLRTADGTNIFGVPGGFSVAGRLQDVPTGARARQGSVGAQERALRKRLMQWLVDRLYRAIG